MSKQYDISIIGGGPAGLAAADSASENGAESILLIDRAFAAGGVLLQCAHTGFGFKEYGRSLTGPEYSKLAYAKIENNRRITVWLDTVVLDITKDKKITCVSPERGLQKVTGKAVILAMGCREQSRGAIRVPGDRLAGIMTAGVAQRLMNVFDFLPGREIVVLGTGDIGFVTAAELVEAGCKVKGIVERYAKPKGLQEHIDWCLDKLKIPLYLQHTISNIHGENRVEKVTVSKVDGEYNVVPGTGFDVDCDTVIMSVGFRPEHKLADILGVEYEPSLGGLIVDAEGRTSLPGFYAAGNVVKIFESVDGVVEQARAAGRRAALDI
ncbi:MAG: NAD(P)/FAD-dependent oxidoreductase [Acidaminococcaceae bacterium]|nr:NAD(P)/FAD-dependent oxidoreductase [Acidaminococcaceae bacterium]